MLGEQEDRFTAERFGPVRKAFEATLEEVSTKERRTPCLAAAERRSMRASKLPLTSKHTASSGPGRTSADKWTHARHALYVRSHGG